MRMWEKTYPYALLFCSNVDCNVATYIIRQEGDDKHCPLCKGAGGFVRRPLDDMPKPERVPS